VIFTEAMLMINRDEIEVRHDTVETGHGLPVLVEAT
jgi:hypothetical protein